MTQVHILNPAIYNGTVVAQTVKKAVRKEQYTKFYTEKRQFCCQCGAI